MRGLKAIGIGRNKELRERACNAALAIAAVKRPPPSLKSFPVVEGALKTLVESCRILTPPDTAPAMPGGQVPPPPSPVQQAEDELPPVLPTLEPGARVRLHSLRFKESLNGRTACVLRFEEASNRYTVAVDGVYDLSGGSQCKLLRKNMALVTVPEAGPENGI